MSSYLFYGYSSPTDGSYVIDGHSFSTNKDFRNAKRYKEYQNVGFNTLLLQRNDPYSGEEFVSSNLKKCMDEAYKSGLTKIVVTDDRLYELSSKTESLIGKNKKFASKESLDEYVSFCVKDYSKHPGFFGLMLRDEPHFEHFAAIKDVQESIMRVLPNCFIQCNLFPSLECAAPFFGSKKDILLEQYNDYVSTFMSMMPQSNVSMDYYPFKINSSGYDFDFNFFYATKTLADLGKKYNKDITFVLQSCEMLIKGKPHLRKMSYQDLLLCFNVSMSFASKGMAFFTYWRKQFNETNGEFFIDGSSFITSKGKKTKIYKDVRHIYKLNQNLMSFIEEDKYQDSLISSDINITFDQLNIINDSKSNLLITKIGEKVYSIMLLGDPDVSKDYKAINLVNLSNFKILKCDGYIKQKQINLKFGDAIFLERR